MGQINMKECKKLKKHIYGDNRLRKVSLWKKYIDDLTKKKGDTEILKQQGIMTRVIYEKIIMNKKKQV